MKEMHHTSLLQPILNNAFSCTPDAHGHCITCSDEALPFTVVRVDAEHGLAEVAVDETGEATEEIDITLVDTVVAGSVVLVHGGVAIALLSEQNDA